MSRAKAAVQATMVVVVLAGVVAPLSVLAACGDGTVDAGEECDDGNALDGDCCSQSCAFEPSYYVCTHNRTGTCLELLQGLCDGAGTCEPRTCDLFANGIPLGSNLDIHDHPGEEHDRLRWAVQGGRRHYSGEPLVGDPTVDTIYAFCIYDVAPDGTLTVRYEKRIEPGPNWRRTATAWVYGEADAGGGAIAIRAKGLARVVMRGAAAELPGPINETQYFGDIAFGLLNSAGYCHLRDGKAGDRNTPTRFHSHYPTFLD